MVLEVTIAKVGTWSPATTAELLIASASKSPKVHSSDEQLLLTMEEFPVDPNTSCVKKNIRYEMFKKNEILFESKTHISQIENQRNLLA